MSGNGKKCMLRFAKIIVIVFLCVMSAGCNLKDGETRETLQNNDTTQVDDTEKNSEENIAQDINKNVVDEKNDYDGDGIADILYNVKKSETEYDWYLSLSRLEDKSKEIYLLTNWAKELDSSCFAIKGVDLTGDGINEVIVSEGGINSKHGYNNTSIYGMKDGIYTEWNLDGYLERSLLAERDGTKIKVECIDNKFADYYWNKLEYFMYGSVAEGRTVHNSKLSGIYITRENNVDVLKFAYFIKDIIEYDEIVSFVDGKEKIVKCEINGLYDNDITWEMKKQNNDEIQYEYEMSEIEKVLFKVKTIIDSSPYECSYTIYCRVEKNENMYIDIGILEMKKRDDEELKENDLQNLKNILDNELENFLPSGYKLYINMQNKNE